MTAALTTDIRDGVAVVTLDLPNAPVNTFARSVREEFAALLDRLERDQAIRAAVIRSGKPDVWVAGADIEEFLEIETSSQAEAMSRDGHALLERLSKLRAPVVAAINGACLGGGLEAALACAYRVATDSPKTVFALPEVQIGLIPGAGGTQRLPRLIGLEAALDMILTGRNVRAKKALQAGLIDELVHPAILDDIAIARARALADGTLARAGLKGPHGARHLLLDENRVGRSIVLRQAREKVLARSRGHYPAPLAALDAVALGYAQGMERGLREEARVFGELAVSEVSRQLVFLFFATTALKKDPGVDGNAPSPVPIRKIGILGAGFMGAGIASIAAPQGTLVRLKDADHGRVGKGLASIRETLRERLTRKQITRQQLDDYMALVGGTIDYSGFRNVDLTIEAVFEDLAVKQRVLNETEEATRPDAIFASNTSTIPIAQIAEASIRPQRVIGMHFFSPVPKMPLLEVIVTPETSREVTTSVVAYGKTLGKTVIVVHDAPGFFANRILAPYINEAGLLLDEGVAIDAIDRALIDFGFPVGPITLIDEVGLDIAGKSGAIMLEAFGSRMAPSQSLQRVVAAGRLGRKGKKGFYRYNEQGKKHGVDPSVYELLPTGARRTEVPADEIQRRCVFAMVNEAVRCLQDGILRAPRDGDIGAVFGIGFPPFRGGPFRYVDSLGAERVVRALEGLNKDRAPRFAPAQLLVEMARAGRRFYPERGHPLAG
ncbi:MAG TPA: fatty acid oxidation complex subunit alpha FadJ [Gemmatimonadaceae bacterium]|nr:fatty acid oxidation complex subunit alpha FadJ [Gemmatimonadaceae bacterium]